VVRVPRRVFQRLPPERADPRAVHRSLLAPVDPVRERCREEDSAAAVDRGREPGDQRAGLAQGPATWRLLPAMITSRIVSSNREHSSSACSPRCVILSSQLKDSIASLEIPDLDQAGDASGLPFSTT
jgi:hypothetical protein